ncbi:MAG: ABC transporter ATP-binding protein [Pseudomonadota bacterium]
MRRLSAQDLAVERGGRRVVEPLSADLKPGEITAICGPNGAGKSSLLMALAGLLPPAAGEAGLDEAPLAALPAQERARAIGYLPQGSDIAWDVSVESLVALGRHAHGDAGGAPPSPGTEAIRRALAATHIADLSQRRVSQLSGGEKARALLARVLAGEPEWILADEPLAALDLAHQLNLIAHFRACAAAGQGVVIVLHDLSLAMNHADRVLVLKEGALIADGPPDDALSPGNIETGWGVAGEWIGAPGARAFMPRT